MELSEYPTYSEIKVSVIIPVYGVEKYIERCAITLFEQTLQEIEYIFVNDCTKDRSIEVLESVLERYPDRKRNVKIVTMPQNSGQAAVREYGMKLATGEYIIHCDSDDWIDVTAYEQLYNCAIDNGSDIVFCDFYKSYNDQNIYVHRDIDISSKQGLIDSVSRHAHWCIWCALAKRSLCTDNNIMYPTSNNGEDFALMFQLIHFAKTFSKVDKPLYYYYINPESITNKPTEEAYMNRYYQLLNNTNLVISFITSQNESGQYEDLINCYKLYCRTKLSPLTGNKRYRKIWQETYPEIKVLDILKNSKIPFRTKLNYIAVRLNIYHILARFNK